MIGSGSTSIASTKSVVPRVQRGELDPVVIAQQHLAAIDQFNPTINALRWVDRSGVIERASKLRDRIRAGEKTGRLAGVFFSAKDGIDVAQMPRSDGSHHLKQDSCSRNAALIDRLLAADAICIGKANQAELGRSYYTENALFGRTNNPYDITRSPGGSGGGDAAAVATGMASFGVGADSGGSIRVPASFCGVYGLSPTRGTISTAGLTHFGHTLTNLLRGHGPIASNLDDCELVYDVLAGFDSADPYSVSRPAKIDRPITKRFGYFTVMNGVHCDPEIAAALKSTVSQLESAGYSGTEISPALFEASIPSFVVLAAQAAIINDDQAGIRNGTPHDLALEGATMQSLRAHVAAGLPPLTAERLLDCWMILDELRQRAIREWNQLDFILAPVAATIAPHHGTSMHQVDGQQLESHLVFQFSSCVNVLGMCALAFPCGKSSYNTTSSGMPIGLQVIGSRFAEPILFNALRALQA